MKEFSNYTNMGIGDMRMNIDLYSQHIVYGSYSAKKFSLGFGTARSRFEAYFCY